MVTKKQPAAKKLSPADKAKMRVAVAKDVLKQLKRKRLLPSQGSGYIYAPVTPAEAVPGCELQKIVDKLPPCTVCALGAALLSYARLYDNVKLESSSSFVSGFSGSRVYLHHNRLHADRPTKVLRVIFPLRMLNLIEGAFENYQKPAEQDYEYYSAEHEQAQAEEALIVVMKNLIKNEGGFSARQVMAGR